MNVESVQEDLRMCLKMFKQHRAVRHEVVNIISSLLVRLTFPERSAMDSISCSAGLAA